MTEFTLRTYQDEASRAAIYRMTVVNPKVPVKKRKNPLIVLPCGSGKSLVIANIVKHLPAPCIVFQPSKEILEQNAEKLCSYGFDPAIYSAAIGRKEIGQITLATIGSVVNKAELFKDVKYVLVDECHGYSDGGMYSKFVSALDSVQVCGFTATPWRLQTDGFGSILKFITRTRKRIFQEVAYYAQNADMVREGYWAPLEYHQVKGFDRSRLRLNSTGADYIDASVQLHFKEIQFKTKLERVVDRLLQIGRPNVLVFTRFIEESEHLCRVIPGAAMITADTPKKERETVLQHFKGGSIPVVANVGCLATGFDYPALSTVVLARPTMSLGLYYQQVGRGVRTHSSKSHAMIVDMVGLSEQFGKVEDLHLQPGGKTGSKWAIYSNGKQLTNVYYEGRK